MSDAEMRLDERDVVRLGARLHVCSGRNTNRCAEGADEVRLIGVAQLPRELAHVGGGSRRQSFRGRLQSVAPYHLRGTHAHIASEETIERPLTPPTRAHEVAHPADVGT